MQPTLRVSSTIGLLWRVHIRPSSVHIVPFSCPYRALSHVPFIHSISSPHRIPALHLRLYHYLYPLPSHSFNIPNIPLHFASYAA